MPEIDATARETGVRDAAVGLAVTMVAAVRLPDTQRSIGEELDGPAALVDGVMVAIAERNQIVEVGIAAVLPQIDVVGLAP